MPSPIRLLGLLTILCGALTTAAQAALVGDSTPADKTKSIIERLHENMDGVEANLGKKDPGKQTQNRQEQILKDLDELIKHRQAGGSGAAGITGNSSTGKDAKIPDQKNPAKSSRKQGARESGTTETKQTAGGLKSGGDSKTDAVKTGAVKTDAVNQAAGEKNGEASRQMNLWRPYLPPRARQDIDAYAKERFLPRYDELLRQYFRALSEQSRRSKGE